MVTKKQAMEDFLTKPEQEEIGKSGFRETSKLETKTVKCSETGIKHRVISFENYKVLGVRLNSENALILDPKVTHSVPEQYVTKLEKLAENNNIYTQRRSYTQLSINAQTYSNTIQLTYYLPEEELYNLLNKEQKRKFTAQHL